ncbi:MAG: VWA domain-containing protein [Terracidiphilus sp.]
MLRSWVIGCVVLALLCWMHEAGTQSPSNRRDGSDGYTMRLPVDEVVLTFNATDGEGLPVNDLKVSEIRLRDNGAAPRRIVAFDELMNRSIRIGILLDTSESMQRTLSANKVVAKEFVERLFRQKTDAGFVSEFGYASATIQLWTGNASLIALGIQRVGEKVNYPVGTALFNAVFQACSSSFDEIDPTATGNLILLFSDGEDNAGLTSLEDAARACQHKNVQVIAFIPSSVQDHASTGPQAVRELALKTGGQVFFADDAGDKIWNDLRTIESGMRNQYRLVYNPENFKHDGAFHEIELQPPDRVRRIEVRSGYFAPRQ